jgi:hypothetical protein
VLNHNYSSLVNIVVKIILQVGWGNSKNGTTKSARKGVPKKLVGK